MRSTFKFISIALSLMLFTGLALGVPSAVSNLNESSYGSSWIIWSWDNPTESDFYQSIISIDGTEVATVDNNTTTYNATGLSSGTSHDISITTTDFNSSAGGIANDSATTSSESDTIAPASVTSLGESSVGTSWILWSWTNPSDSDFNQSVISINGTEAATVDNTTTSYNATGLSSGTSYEISIVTKDLSGNSGTAVIDNATTSSGSDTTAPASVASLGESSVGTSWILWSWTNPSDSDFNQSVISIDGSVVATVDNTTTSYNATGLSSDTSYEISIVTKDLTGNSGTAATDSATTSSSSSSSDAPVASFDTNVTDDEGEAPLIVQFNDTSTNSPTSWAWDFDDGSDNSTVQDPVHTFSSEGTYNVTLTATNSYGSDTTTTTITVYDEFYYTGNRIWDENANQSADKYIWDAKSFSGFYYDLESGMSSENLTIYNIDRSIDEGDIVYETRPVETDFEYGDWGSYQVIGFMAEKYFAGYTEDTEIDDADEVSMMASGQLSKVLMDDDDDHKIFDGSSLELEDGYELNIAEVDVNGESVLVTLTKDGDDLDDSVVSSGETYTYTTDLGDADDVVILAVHVDYVFSGTESNAVFIDGIFQISDEYVELEDGDNYGEMEITSISDDLIEMENEDTVSLSEGDTIELMGSINLIVADNSDLRFGPYVDMSDPGTYELRGTVAEDDELLTWTPLNFEGFYYDIDEGIMTETLELKDISDRKIAAGDLEYTSTATSVEFEHSDWGEFDVIGFMAEKYFVGYSDDTDIDGADDVSLLSDGQLSKVLLDEDDKVTVSSGSSLELEEGYTLEIVEVDVNGDRVLVNLYKDGDEVDSGIAASNSDYVYEVDLGDSDNVPLIVIHFTTVFSGTESDAVFVKGIFQISDEYVTLESGDSFDEMEVDSFSSTTIEMSNDGSISLSTGDDITLMGDVGIRVADDSDTVRYYPYVDVTTGTSGTLSIDVDSTIIMDDEVTITVTSSGALVSDVTIKQDGTTIGTTDDNGTLDYTFDEAGSFELTAVKDGYTTGSEDIEVIDENDESNKMSIEVSPDEIYPGTSTTIYVTEAIGGSTISDVSVAVDGTSIGTTGSDGTVTYTPTDVGTHTIAATKSGLLDAESTFKVLEMAADYEYSDMEISPLEVKQGKEVTINVNITNSGTASGSENVSLLINDEAVDSQTVTLDIGESTTIEFTYDGNDEVGTYKAQIGDVSETYEVVEKSSIVLYVLGAIALAAIGGVGYLFTAGGWTVEIAQAKAAEAVEAAKELIGNLR